MKPLYFGVLDPKQSGHHLYDPDLRALRDSSLPAWLKMSNLDGDFCIHRPGQPQGVALVHHLGDVINDVTVMAMWDRTGDSRPGSSSTFVVEGTHDFEAMCKHASEAFPSVWKRICSKPVTLGSICEDGMVTGLPMAVAAWLAEPPDMDIQSMELSSSVWEAISRIKPVVSDTGTQISRLPSGIPVDRNAMLPPRFIRLTVVPLPSMTEVQEMAAFFKVLVKL